jgi:hypothetical protein
MFNEIQGKIICKSVDCDVCKAFNFTTTKLDLQETNVKANDTHITATHLKNMSTQPVYKFPLFFFLEKREKKNVADS